MKKIMYPKVDDLFTKNISPGHREFCGVSSFSNNNNACIKTCIIK